MITLARIAQIIDGNVAGDEHYEVETVASLEKATNMAISFLSDPKKKQFLSDTRAGAILIAPENAHLFSGNKILVTNPYLAYAKISGLFKRYPSTQHPGIDLNAKVSEQSNLEETVSIGNYSTVEKGAYLGADVIVGNGVHIGEDVRIGNGTVIEDNVVVASGCRIGKCCFISPGVVIGASGFGYAPNKDKWQKIEQIGSVVIGDDVDIGSNSTIDRGALDNTVIEDGVKIDNQVQIAHNVVLGENTIMAGFSGVAGSTQVGKRCKIGARVSILGHLKITDDVTVMANSTVANDLNEPGEYASLISVQPLKQWRKTLAIIRRIDKLALQVKALVKQ